MNVFYQLLRELYTQLLFLLAVTSLPLPKEHRKVTNKSFGPLYAEGIYLHSDSATPNVWMFDMISKTAMMVSDFKTYPDQFPMRDPTCLVSASFTQKDVQDMHTEDVIDDADLAAPPAPPLTRSRAQSLQVPLPATPSVPPATFAPVLPQPPPPVSIFDQPFSSMTESELVTTFLNNNVAFVLPSQYRPPTFPPPEADMIVIGTSVRRLSKQKSDFKLWVRFLSPPSYKNKKLQLYPHSLEPHEGPGQGQDFSLLSALALQHPSALTLHDIVITEGTRTDTTAVLLHALPTCQHTEGSSASTAHVSDPDRVLPVVLGHKKWNDDVLICDRLLRADSTPFEVPLGR